MCIITVSACGAVNIAVSGNVYALIEFIAIFVSMVAYILTNVACVAYRSERDNADAKAEQLDGIG